MLNLTDLNLQLLDLNPYGAIIASIYWFRSQIFGTYLKTLLLMTMKPLTTLLSQYSIQLSESFPGSSENFPNNVMSTHNNYSQLRKFVSN